jgi:Tfp pilus assembly protein PilO
MLEVLLALLPLAPPLRPFPEERLLLDRRLETLRRILPEGPHPEVDVAVVRQLTQDAGLSFVEIGPRAPTERGSRGEVRIELTALGRFADVERFFRQTALSPRLIDVESVTLSSTQESLVRIKTAALPFAPLKALGGAKAPRPS